jgi:hypothetical protein
VLLSLLGGRLPQLRPGQRSRHTDRHELELRLRVGVAVALGVGAVEGLAQVLRVRRELCVHSELERLTRVAQLEGGSQLGVGRAEVVPAALTERPHDLRHSLGNQLLAREEDALHDVAPPLGGDETDGR